MSITLVQAQLGHTTSQPTRQYMHPDLDQQRAAAALVEASWRETSGENGR